MEQEKEGNGGGSINKITGIRERALAEENWCAIKHLLCAEEHVLETIQKLQRRFQEREDKEALVAIIELSRIADSIRALRQRLVDYAFEFERWSRDEGAGGMAEGGREKG